MELRNCSRCGKLFVKEGPYYCMECKVKQDQLYHQVRDYVKEHPGSTIMDVHHNTGISIPKLLELQKEYTFSL